MQFLYPVKIESPNCQRQCQLGLRLEALRLNTRTSIYTKFRPMQSLGRVANGIYPMGIFPLMNRSGLNSAADGPQTALSV